MAALGFYEAGLGDSVIVCQGEGKLGGRFGLQIKLHISQNVAT